MLNLAINARDAMPHGGRLKLSMVYGFVNQSQGDIAIDSGPNQGTCIRIWLPVARPVEGQAAANRGQLGEALTQGHGEHLLVVEDDAGVRELLERQLVQLGYQVMACDGPEEALTLLRSDMPIDVLLTDIVLAGVMDGVELAERSLDLRPGLKTVFMTGYTRKHEEIGNRLLLRKPLALLDLAEVLQKALKAA